MNGAYRQQAVGFTTIQVAYNSMWAIIALYGVLLLVRNDLFRSELTWDGIIAIIAIVLGVIATLIPFLWRRWRCAHPLRVQFSLDPYKGHGQEEWERKLAPNWDLDLLNGQMLLRLSPHVDFNLRSVRVRFVQRTWFTRRRLWTWTVASTAVIRPTHLRDSFCETAASPLYYFDTGTDEPPDSTFLSGKFFNDHDSSRGVDVSQGDFIWLGVHVGSTDFWKGRLEIEMPVNGPCLKTGICPKSLWIDSKVRRERDDSSMWPMQGA